MASQIQNVHILSIEKVSVSGLSKSAAKFLKAKWNSKQYLDSLSLDGRKQ